MRLYILTLIVGALLGVGALWLATHWPSNDPSMADIRAAVVKAAGRDYRYANCRPRDYPRNVFDCEASGSGGRLSYVVTITDAGIRLTNRWLSFTTRLP